VTLQGPVLAHDLDTLLETVGQVRGVSETINELEVHRRRPSGSWSAPWGAHSGNSIRDVSVSPIPRRDR
jgi:hypothetical protein